MSGIECVNLLALIQFIIAFDFGLFYLDDKDKLTKIYIQCRVDLVKSIEPFLSDVNALLKQTLKSDNEECILKSAYLDKVYRQLKYFADKLSLSMKGFGFVGLYAGIYGFICLFCLGIFGCQHEALIKNYILVTSQIILGIELFVLVFNFIHEGDSEYYDNVWLNIKFILFIIAFSVGISYFDWTYKYFAEFEFPFVVISLVVLLFPIIQFISYIVIAHIVVLFLKLRCKYYIRQIDKCLKKENETQD